jgi:hypothetical protein
MPFVAFKTATDSLAAALTAQLALVAECWGETGPLRVRMAMHNATTEERDGDYRSASQPSETAA